MTDALTLQRRPEVDVSDLPAEMPWILRQLLARRGITTAEQLDLRLQRLPHFAQLHDAERAAKRLWLAIERQEHICICGDFDADGATSTALMVSVLRAMGAQQVSYCVPNRFTDGYGLSPNVVSYAQQQGAQLLLTVDSGISCHAGVDAANAAGLDVIITDHHLAGAELPKAYAIVNPNQPACGFPSKSIAGVGVAFYVLLALRAQARERQHHAAQLNLAEWLDLVALGTVADVVKLDGTNRVLVQQGLQRIRAGHCRPGIQALLQVTQREPERLQATDLGFALAPRINAAGRLDDMAIGIECLLSEDINTATELAAQLNDLNAERRSIESEMRESAASYVADLQLTEAQLPPLLVLHEAGWHQGVVGIVAGRVKEQFHRPTITFAAGDDGLLKGSARSIPGLHMRDLLERVHTLQPNLIERFGGHAMAAGLSLAPENLEAFKQAAVAVAEEWLEAEALERTIVTDGSLDASCFTQGFVEQLQRLGPWGQGFPEPLFDDTFELVQQRIVGKNHLKMVVRSSDGIILDAIAFNVDTNVWPDLALREAQLVYKLQLNHFRGRTNVQLLVEHLLPLR
ncbi:MAG: single-stranded-DNA-specific exonuclease RecJ [Idiomarinaceae bacterium]|uniref:Single-stranded-DNA-specific exonuclease RecJ n=1 Tax=Pseudidiomarina aquimaris TaxID=641841 RepID=A0A432XQD9_9GAMM|nr:single-stranded-DNA-specific exonuclease RecJ [Pseudidiomarina aquimaris]MBG22584.1 single-stranded-DNA-specific exonuclease RecJ [Idiomarinaceae bacterium]RUO50949.1 single-stranded-DNA-specific exonuclease RecJ [Pseudidiomarina aquimaris]|tara:strand:- start:3920 stop:5641 length:1722 start_codon:yes stop_codon:yes gene_type:complete